jgi:hypothetical protein
MRGDLGVAGWRFATPTGKNSYLRFTRLSCLFLIYKGIRFWPLETVLPVGVAKCHPATPTRAQAG